MFTTFLTHVQNSSVLQVKVTILFLIWAVGSELSSFLPVNRQMTYTWT